jgi:hypothetical protein
MFETINIDTLEAACRDIKELKKYKSCKLSPIALKRRRYLRYKTAEKIVEHGKKLYLAGLLLISDPKKYKYLYETMEKQRENLQRM